MSYNSSDGGAAALAYAEATFMGKPYRFGGNYPPLGTSDGTDCSGLVQNAYNHVGVSLPRTTETQCFEHQISVKGPFEPGDCLYFTGAPSDPPPGHVGIYVGVGAISTDQHTFHANPRGAVVIFNAPYTDDPHGIRYDYAAGLFPILYATRPALALPKPPPPPHRPNAEDLKNAHLASLPNVATATKALKEGFRLFYWNTTALQFDAQKNGKPTGVTLYVNIDFFSKAN